MWYPITDTTDQWSPIFDDVPTCLSNISPQLCTSYDHVVPKCALCTPQVHHMDCRIALPTTTWCQKVLYVHHRCTTWTNVGLHFLRPRGAKKCSMYTTGAPHGLLVVIEDCTSYDHVVLQNPSALCTPQVHHMDCRIAWRTIPTTTWCRIKVLYVHHRCTTWSNCRIALPTTTWWLTSKSPRSANSMYTTGSRANPGQAPRCCNGR